MKVLAFDSWTPGSKYLSTLSRYLVEQGYPAIKLLHVESILKFSTPKSQSHVFINKDTAIVNGVECIDYSVYGGSIYDAIKAENPDVLLMLSVSHMANRVAVAACKRLGIPVYYIMHGELADAQQCKEIKELSRDANKKNHILKLKKLHKYTSLTWQYYLASKSLSESLGLYTQIIKDSFSFIWTPLPHRSLEVDKALVFSQSDIGKVSARFRLSESKVSVVGNLRTCDGLYEAKVGSAAPPIDKPYILYMDQSFVDSGFISIEKYESMLRDVSRVARDKGYKVLCKMHPRANLTNYEKLNIEGVYLDFESSLESCISNSSLVLGHYSSALKDCEKYGKYVVCLHFYGDIRDKDLIESDFIFSCQSLDKLSYSIEQALNKPKLFYDNESNLHDCDVILESVFLELKRPDL